MGAAKFETCFVVMPIVVPGHLTVRYHDRADHFQQIHDYLIAPAIESAGLSILPTVRVGTENIQAAIINDLQDADLVLADLSGVNPNVFLELGIRSALDRPVCLISDGLDKLPFDSATLNTHKYDPQPVYELNNEIARLADFIRATTTKSDGRNELWKYFGSASNDLPTAELDPEDARIHAKLDRLVGLVEAQTSLTVQTKSPPTFVYLDTLTVEEVLREVHAALTLAGDIGVHGDKVRRTCMSMLGDAYEGFLGGGSLSQALTRRGVLIRTDRSGTFFLSGTQEFLGPAIATGR